jgi:amidase
MSSFRLRIPTAVVSTLIAAVLSACSPSPKPELAPEPHPAEELWRLGAHELRKRFEEGSLDSRTLVSHLLERIDAIDRSGPTLRAVIEVAPDALLQADRLDAERRAGMVRGPLHGIPVLVKDNIAAVGMANSAGSLALAQHYPGRDAELVDRLRKAGAVILGKTNLSEWANFRGSRSISGWSSRGGQTRNPHVLDRSPCGSSSGSAVAVAAGLVPLAIGTETDGSILCPAAVNGIVGLKPTVGRISRHGIIPIAASQDTAGPMARSARDAGILLAAIAGPEDKDAPHALPGAESQPSLQVDLGSTPLEGLRLGVLRERTGYHTDLESVFEREIAPRWPPQIPPPLASQNPPGRTTGLCVGGRTEGES